ncbi:hypothetical protein B2J88_16115 [Rhodococcus sp. SRB_17]|nr:hypothetical protein [Rhodococcus sp. SRB_17]
MSPEPLSVAEKTVLILLKLVLPNRYCQQLADHVTCDTTLGGASDIGADFRCVEFCVPGYEVAAVATVTK